MSSDALKRAEMRLKCKIAEKVSSKIWIKFEFDVILLGNAGDGASEASVCQQEIGG